MNKQLYHIIDSLTIGDKTCNSFTSTHYLTNVFAIHTMAQEQAHCASNIVSKSHLFHSKLITLPIPKIWLLNIWPWKSKVKVMGEAKV